MTISNLPGISFKDATEFACWLASNFQSSSGVWLQFYKRGADVQSITYAEALDEVLCFGWIDGQVCDCMEDPNSS